MERNNPGSYDPFADYSQRPDSQLTPTGPKQALYPQQTYPVSEPPVDPDKEKPTFEKQVSGLDTFLVFITFALSMVIGGLVVVFMAIYFGADGAGWALPVVGLIQIAMVVGILKIRKYRWSDLGFVRPKTGWHMAWQIPGTWIAVLMVGASLGSLFLSEPEADTGQAIRDTAAIGPVMMFGVILLAVFILPLVEEIVFRRFLYSWLEMRLGKKFGMNVGVAAAVVISGVLFGLMHVVPAAVVMIGCLGIAMAVLLRINRSMWAPMALHMLNNAVATAVALSML